MAARPRVLRAIFPNAGVQAWYQRQIESEIATMGRSLAPVLRDLYPAARDEIAQDAERKKPIERLRDGLAAWGERWTKRFDNLATDLATQFSGRAFATTQATMMRAFKTAGFTVQFRPTKASVAAYQATIAENINLIKSIPAQFLKDVQSATWESVMRGGDLATLSVELQQKYGVSFRRAALISRDQNNKAKAVIENTRRKELGITEAYWQHSNAGKEPRPTHVDMSGKRYKLNEGMWDEDEKAFVFPGELINCRCTSRAVLPGFD